MRFAYTARLHYRLVDGVVLALEFDVVLGPQPMNNLGCLTECAHAIPQLRPRITVGAPFVLVPSGTKSRVQPTVTGHIDGRGDLCVQCGIPVPITPNHLPDIHPTGVTG